MPWASIDRVSGCSIPLLLCGAKKYIVGGGVRKDFPPVNFFEGALIVAGVFLGCNVRESSECVIE